MHGVVLVVYCLLQCGDLVSFGWSVGDCFPCVLVGMHLCYCYILVSFVWFGFRVWGCFAGISFVWVGCGVGWVLVVVCEGVVLRCFHLVLWWWAFILL